MEKHSVMCGGWFELLLKAVNCKDVKYLKLFLTFTTVCFNSESGISFDYVILP